MLSLTAVQSYLAKEGVFEREGDGGFENVSSSPLAI